MKTNWGTGTDMLLCAHLAAVLLLLCTLTPSASGQQYYLYESKAVTDDEKAANREDGVLVVEVPVEKGDTLYAISRKFSGKGTYYPQILLFNKIENPDLIYAGKSLKVPVTKTDDQSRPAPAKVSAAKSRRHNSAKKTAKSKAVASVPARQLRSAAPAATPATELSLSDLKNRDGAGSNNRTEKKKVASQAPVSEKSEKDFAATRAASQAPPRDKKEKAGGSKTGGEQVSGGDATASQKLFEKAVSAYRRDDFNAALELFDRYLADNASSPLAADASLFKAECYLKLSSK